MIHHCSSSIVWISTLRPLLVKRQTIITMLLVLEGSIAGPHIYNCPIIHIAEEHLCDCKVRTFNDPHENPTQVKHRSRLLMTSHHEHLVV